MATTKTKNNRRPAPRELAEGGALLLTYGGNRQRYLTRELDPETLQPITGGDTWSDYLGDSIYADYTVDSGNVTMTKRYMPGQWQTDLTPLGDTPPGDPETLFFHNNALGTARLLSDDDGEMSGGSVRLYTAFGDWVNRGAEFLHNDTRYGYAGAWGYQPLKGGDSNFGGLMHVGARTYDPELGRWLQRDPIGIYGGLNVYAYVKNGPLRAVDSSGLGTIYPGDRHSRAPVIPGYRFPFHPLIPEAPAPSAPPPSFVPPRGMTPAEMELEAQDEYDRSNWDRTLGVADTLVDWGTMGWVQSIGCAPFDPANRADAADDSKVIIRVVGTLLFVKKAGTWVGRKAVEAGRSIRRNAKDFLCMD